MLFLCPIAAWSSEWWCCWCWSDLICGCFFFQTSAEQHTEMDVTGSITAGQSGAYFAALLSKDNSCSAATDRFVHYNKGFRYSCTIHKKNTTLFTTRQSAPSEPSPVSTQMLLPSWTSASCPDGCLLTQFTGFLLRSWCSFGVQVILKQWMNASKLGLHRCCVHTLNVHVCVPAANTSVRLHCCYN